MGRNGVLYDDLVDIPRSLVLKWRFDTLVRIELENLNTQLLLHRVSTVTFLNWC